jgi:YfiH family protein
MPFQQRDFLRTYSFDALDESGLVHAVFTRRGGFSPAPWDSLNLGGTVGDDPTRVKANRMLSFQAMRRDPNTLYDVWLVHSAKVVFADSPRDLDSLPTKADAILTDRPEVTLFMRFADCTPIILHDPVRRVAGVVHAGWLGTVRGVARAAVKAMVARYGCKLQDIRAAIGPSIAAHHYPVGDEVVQQVQEAFGMDAASLLPSSNGAVQFDLWAANQLILEQSGVRQIEVAGLCTACHLEDWYSHRGEKGKTGRFGVLVALKE